MARCRYLRRNLARKGRAGGRPLSRDLTVRCAVDDGARLCLALISAHRASPLDVRHLHRGDFDPCGVNAEERERGELAPTPKSTSTLRPRQISEWNLPTRPTKKSDTRAKGFGDISVELDAIDPNDLRDLVRMAIEQHLPEHQFEILKAAEESERTEIRKLVAKVT